jgi:hypothetical protein
VTPAFWLMAAALPLAGPEGTPPKLLINAKVDTHSAAAGLEREFRPLLATQPQPAWIGYTVPAAGGGQLGCELVSPGGWYAPGVIHLEPPGHAVILYRVEANAVSRIRALSPDCEIDAGGAPVHWLTDVQPAESVALLVTFVPQRDVRNDGVLKAIALHAGPAADAALEKLVAPDQPESLRQRTVPWFGSARGRRGFEVLKNLIANDPSEAVRERAISALAVSKEPEAADLLVSTARSDRNPRLRAQAIAALGRNSGPKTVAVIREVIEKDPDAQVRRRAVSALHALPDGEGIPLLIEVVKTTQNADVRKQAMSSLGQSRDPRALAYFEDVLKH